MAFFSGYSIYIGIAVVTIVISIVAYIVRVKYIHRHIMPYPMQVVVCPDAQYYHPPHQLSQHPQMCWSIPMEQPPPAYHTVVTEMDTNRNIVNINNHS